jgi:hypothetical protein
MKLPLKMIFEQPKELNEFVEARRAMTFEERWTQIMLIMPMWAAVCIYLTELRLAMGMTVWPALATACLLILLAIGMARLLDRAGLDRRYKRTLELNDRGIRTSRTGPWTVRWKAIASFIIEPAGQLDEFKRITVRFINRNPRRWSMVLADTLEYQALLAELKRRQAAGDGKFTIEIFHQPIPPPKEIRLKLAPHWLMALGFLLVLNGLPILAGILPKDDNYEPHRPVKINPKLATWVQRNFTNFDDFRHFLLVTGGALTGAGVGCMSLGGWLVNRDARKGSTGPVADQRIVPPICAT